MAFQQPGKIVFEGGGGAGQTSPQAPGASTIPYAERENKSELIFGPLTNISVPAGEQLNYAANIPPHLKNKRIMLILYVHAESQIKTQFSIFLHGTEFGISLIQGTFIRKEEIYAADWVRIAFQNTDTANARNVARVELYAYDLSKVKVFI